MSIRLPAVSVLALASALLGVAGTARAQTSDPPASPVPQHLTRSCAGFAGFSCPKGQLCLDDPSDECDPSQGGADCIGLCVKKSDCQRPPACDYNNPRRRYVAKSPEKCATIRFFCQPGFQAFFDDCGCGCERVRGQQEQGAPRK
jgi:hypothetical protein